jgi:hypothetical protein
MSLIRLSQDNDAMMMRSSVGRNHSLSQGSISGEKAWARERTAASMCDFSSYAAIAPLLRFPREAATRNASEFI